MKAIRIHQVGGPEQMKLEEVETPRPAPGQVLVKIAASGVNFIDVYFRTGLYPAPTPFTPGMEAAGTVEAVGEGVTEFGVGDRVAYAMTRGSYAEYALVPAHSLVKVPDGLELETAAAAMLQGMTAHYLSHSTFPLNSEHTALIHAAAGGTGALLTQMAKMRGARVIATVGSASKAARARQAGADEVILYNEQDFEAETRRLTNGRGVDVVYDSVGASTFLKSLNCLRPRGMMVTFGNASGPVPAIEPLLLSSKGSLFLTRPTLTNYCASRDELLWRAGDVLSWVASGALKLEIYQTYELADAPQAHRDLEGRVSSGKLLLRIG
ncbi:MAG: quinone oxidoreductase [Bryobacteraceae bacterium]|nr:quinone oxidoreductase [Bryobacteraceae bacterium]MDW8380192.1 quinone oxidoreductase [Bryobacterales bacterium]